MRKSLSPREAAAGGPSRFRTIGRVLATLLVLNVAVSGAKILYGTASGALSIRADGIHSASDAANNVIGLISIWLSSRPADEGHAYGHRKFELLAAGSIGLVLLWLAFDVLASALSRLAGGGDAPSIDATGFAVLAGTLGVNLFVATYEARRGRELQSPFLLADAAHTRSDVLVTLSVIASMVAVTIGYGVFDAVAAVVVAFFIAWTGTSILRSNVRYLVDATLVDPEDVMRAVRGVPGVSGAHKIRSRGVPGAILVDLHIQIAPHLDVVRAHEVTHWVIDAVKAELPGVVEVVVHTEPARPGEPYLPLPWERNRDEPE